MHSGDQLEQFAQPLPLSFAVPLRNAERYVQRLLDSLLAQDFPQFEIVISDNASTDRTAEICQSYAQRDGRIRYYRNVENIGLNANFNRVLQLARGKYIRWIGWDDWLEPDYARRCLELLAARPEIIGVTTYQDFWGENGQRDYREFTGERLDSQQPAVRYRRMLWFMSHDFRYIDPIYTMMRRDILLRIGGHRLDVIAADQVLAVEISLQGAIAHIPLCLSHRGRPPYDSMTRDQLLRQNYHTNYDLVQKQGMFAVMMAFWQPVEKMQLKAWQKIPYRLPWLRYCGIIICYELIDQIRSLARPPKRMLKKLVNLFLLSL